MQLQLKKLIMVWLILLGVSTTISYGQANFVFRIIASNCKYNLGEKNGKTITNYSTGFLYKKNGNTLGIVTTLHGVCACSSIYAEDSNGKITDKLTISKVDIDHDVALLTSNQLLSQFSFNGFEFSPIEPPSLSDKSVIIYGYPFGRELINRQKNGKISEPPTGSLKRLLSSSSEIKKSLSARSSPNIDGLMLNLEAEIAPGQSGSPIIIGGKVVGIGNGGIGEGYATCWAVPVKNINFATTSSFGPRYTNLEFNNPNQLFRSTCNIENNDLIQDWNDKEYPGATMVICPGKVPNGWVLIDEKKCNCCASSDSWGMEWTIQKIKGMLPDSKVNVCEHSPIPPGWAVIDTTIKCLCCSQDGQGNQIIIRKLKLGDPHEGGVVFYLDEEGYGLISALLDQDTLAPWGCSNKFIRNASDSIVYSGSENTSSIVNDCSDSHYAAKICDNYRAGGKSDWYLPSKKELLLLYEQRRLVGNFTNKWYWSSTQDDSNQAIQVNFASGKSGPEGKPNSYRVRAIRKF